MLTTSISNQIRAKTAPGNPDLACRSRRRNPTLSRRVRNHPHIIRTWAKSHEPLRPLQSGTLGILRRKEHVKCHRLQRLERTVETRSRVPVQKRILERATPGLTL